MKIGTVSVRGYRCLADVTIDLDDYSAFIGANGAGKSSILYALDWFFNGGSLSESDVHGHVEGGLLTPDAVVEVEVILEDLSAHDRERLQRYGRGERAQFRRTWNPATGATKMVGNTLQGPGFAELRALSKVGEFRPKYAELRGQLTELPDLGSAPSKDAVHNALEEWEANPAHKALLVEVPDSEANHLFGINGQNVLKECLRFVLIPAATNIASQVGGAGKGSALSELIGAVMAEASARAQAEWLSENAEVIADLKAKVHSSVESSTGIQADRINSRLQMLVPTASVTLTPSVPDWSPKADASVSTAVTVDGVTNDVSRQGHGVQRAVMMSMFQALVPDEELTRGTHQPFEGEDDDGYQQRLANLMSRLPSLVVCIEEPEIYQHPVRARSFARTLTEFSEQPNVQVVLATHSPYFVRPEQFSALRRFSIVRGKTETIRTTVESIATQTGIPTDQLRKAVERMLPTQFSEGFFADGVVLVEGQTDRAVLEAIAQRLGGDLSGAGVSVVDVQSKDALRMPHAILSVLGVPVYTVVDGDALGASRKHAPTPKRLQTRMQVTKHRRTESRHGCRRQRR